MSGVATAIAGAAVVGAIASDKASSKASKTAQQTTDKQLAFQQDQADKARADINQLFPQATQRRNQGYQQSMDFLSSALPATLGFMQQGNVGAQNVIAGSMPQIQNAILGGNIDYSFMQPQQIDYQQQLASVLAGLPTIYDPNAIAAANAQQNNTAQGVGSAVVGEPMGVAPPNFSDVNAWAASAGLVPNDLGFNSLPQSNIGLVGGGGSMGGGGFGMMGGTSGFGATGFGGMNPLSNILSPFIVKKG